MASKVKMTVSIDAVVAEQLREASRRRGVPRSRLVEEAVRLWRRQQLEQELKEGYEAMADADRTLAEERLAAGSEVIE